MASGRGTKSVIILHASTDLGILGGGRRRWIYGGCLTANLCVCTITRRRESILRCNLLLFAPGKQSSSDTGVARKGWETNGASSSNRNAHNQSMGMCDWALDGRSERGDRTSRTRHVSILLLYAVLPGHDDNRYLGATRKESNELEDHTQNER